MSDYEFKVRSLVLLLSTSMPKRAKYEILESQMSVMVENYYIIVERSFLQKPKK